LSILGLGTDIVTVARIADLVGRHGDRFLNRCFWPDEIQLAQSHGPDGDASLAGRWAAKEAFLKALGRSVSHIPYRDVEVVESSDGTLMLQLHGKALELLNSVGGEKCLLSLSHEGEFALATVLILK
jgi:holo-[acyl-carrier protein] synthase